MITRRVGVSIRQSSRWRGTSTCVLDAQLQHPTPSDYCSRDVFRRNFSTDNHSTALSSSSWKVNLDSGIISCCDGKDERKYQTVIGMEIHAQLDIPTKLFSPAPKLSASASSSIAPNTRLHPMDVGVPGYLPIISQEAIQGALLTAAACQCQTIPRISRFERKHYMYADLPLGYQITQQRWPFAKDGHILCHRRRQKGSGGDGGTRKNNLDGTTFTIGIDRIQLEQDSGKTISTTTKTKSTTTSNVESTTTTTSLVDFHRAGCALVEIVFQPDIRSPKDAALVVETLRDLLRHVGTCNGKMEEGSLRCDLNISIAPILDDNDDNGGTTTWKQSHDDDNKPNNNNNPYASRLPPNTGERVEVKNLNSLQQVLRAAEYEAKRQAAATTTVSNNIIERETRTWDVVKRQTIVLRTKEDEVDYRFLPEPDLPPIVLSSTQDNSNNNLLDGLSVQDFIKHNLRELPHVAAKRLQTQYQLSEYQAHVITGDPPAVDFYEETVQVVKKNLDASFPAKKIHIMTANWLCNDLFGQLHRNNDDDDNHYYGSSISHCPITPNQLGQLVAMHMEGIQITTPMAKRILRTMISEHEKYGTPQEVAKELGCQVIIDMDQLRQICRDCILEKEMEQYRMGERYERRLKKLWMGKAMGVSKRNAHPERLQDALEDVIAEKLMVSSLNSNDENEQ